METLALHLKTGGGAAAPSLSPGQFVTVTVGKGVYGIDIMQVREIRRWSATTPLPNSAHGMSGVLDIRGAIVEVYDLREILGEPQLVEDKDRVIVVVSQDGKDAGVIADAVSDIIFVGETDKQLVPSAGQHHQGMVSHLVRTEQRIIAILEPSVLFPQFGPH